MKGRKNRASGGGMDSPSMGTREYEQDLSSNPESRVNAPKITKAAEERKRGGKAMGKVAGMAAKAHMGRKPRKAGGRVVLTAALSPAPTAVRRPRAVIPFLSTKKAGGGFGPHLLLGGCDGWCMDTQRRQECFWWPE
jgi:hypothetical protein